ncbi:hypothetical protein F5Y04DRAFT_260119 [Hypomontagnella monticulosa]|nr:hypothetical protein F5Y04DRAFT_260119 [Hypomontagnella monticulosa]
MEAEEQPTEQPPILPFTQPSHPTVTDAEKARLLLQDRIQPTTLPPELAIHIVSLGYNPWLAHRRVHEWQFQAQRHPEDIDSFSVAGLYMSTARIPGGGGNKGGTRTVLPQRIIFQTRAADQGWATWGGEGTFGNSHTWFEASILRPCPGPPGAEVNENKEEGGALEEALAEERWWDVRAAREALRERGWEFVEAPDGSVAWRVCNNITARSEYRDYRVEWKRGVETEVEDERAVGKGEGFLELLEPGCCVVLWARAEEAHWCNRVMAATIEIEYKLV